MVSRLIILIAAFCSACSSVSISDIREARYTCSVHERMPVFSETIEQFIARARGIYLVMAANANVGDVIDRLEVVETLSGDQRSEVPIIVYVSDMARLGDSEVLSRHASRQFYSRNEFGAQSYNNYLIDGEICVWIPVIQEGAIYLYIDSDVTYQKTVQPIPDLNNDAWLSFVREHAY